MTVKYTFNKSSKESDLAADIEALDDQKLFIAYSRRCKAAAKRGRSKPFFSDDLYAAYQRAVHRSADWVGRIPLVVSDAFYDRLEADCNRQGPAALENFRAIPFTLSWMDIPYARTP